MRERFLLNLKTIEQGLVKSTAFDIAQKGLDKGALAQVCVEIFKTAIQGAIALEELALKHEESALNLEKMRSDIELSILNAKANVKNADAEALKNLIQAASIIRSVSDNAKINQANASVGFLNTISQASNTGGMQTYLSGVLAIIESINTKPMTMFDEPLSTLLLKDNSHYGSKNIIIHAQKTLLNEGEFVELKGISTFGENKTKWLINDELVASNTKNYLFEAQNIGEYKVAFCAQNENGESERDELIIKVINGELNKEKDFLKKF